MAIRDINKHLESVGFSNKKGEGNIVDWKTKDKEVTIAKGYVSDIKNPVHLVAGIQNLRRNFEEITNLITKLSDNNKIIARQTKSFLGSRNARNPALFDQLGKDEDRETILNIINGNNALLQKTDEFLQKNSDFVKKINGDTSSILAFKSEAKIFFRDLYPLWDSLKKALLHTKELSLELANETEKDMNTYFNEAIREFANFHDSIYMRGANEDTLLNLLKFLKTLEDIKTGENHQLFTAWIEYNKKTTLKKIDSRINEPSLEFEDMKAIIDNYYKTYPSVAVRVNEVLALRDKGNNYNDKMEGLYEEFREKLFKKTPYEKLFSEIKKISKLKGYITSIRKGREEFVKTISEKYNIQEHDMQSIVLFIIKDKELQNLLSNLSQKAKEELTVSDSDFEYAFRGEIKGEGIPINWQIINKIKKDDYKVDFSTVDQSIVGLGKVFNEDTSNGLVLAGDFKNEILLRYVKLIHEFYQMSLSNDDFFKKIINEYQPTDSVFWISKFDKAVADFKEIYSKIESMAGMDKFPEEFKVKLNRTEIYRLGDILNIHSKKKNKENLTIIKKVTTYLRNNINDDDLIDELSKNKRAAASGSSTVGKVNDAFKGGKEIKEKDDDAFKKAYEELINSLTNQFHFSKSLLSIPTEENENFENGIKSKEFNNSRSEIIKTLKNLGFNLKRYQKLQNFDSEKFKNFETQIVNGIQIWGNTITSRESLTSAVNFVTALLSLFGRDIENGGF